MPRVAAFGLCEFAKQLGLPRSQKWELSNFPLVEHRVRAFPARLSCVVFVFVDELSETPALGVNILDDAGRSVFDLESAGRDGMLPLKNSMGRWNEDRRRWVGTGYSLVQFRAAGRYQLVLIDHDQPLARVAIDVIDRKGQPRSAD